MTSWLTGLRRRDLVTTGAGAVGGMLFAGGCAYAVAPGGNRGGDGISSTLRRGVVLAEPPPTGEHVTVDVEGEGVLALPYLSPYVPVAGDEVAVSVLVSGANTTRMVLSGQSGRSGNLVVNGDFHAIASLTAQQPPHMWGHHRIAGRTTVAVSLISPTTHRPVAVLSSYPEQRGDNVLYCAAFTVRPGEVITCDAVAASTLVGAVHVELDLRIAWYTDIAAAYPAHAGEQVMHALSVTVDGDWPMTGAATVPQGVNAARVAVRARHDGPTGSQYTLHLGHVYAQRKA